MVVLVAVGVGTAVIVGGVLLVVARRDGRPRVRPARAVPAARPGSAATSRRRRTSARRRTRASCAARSPRCGDAQSWLDVVWGVVVARDRHRRLRGHAGVVGGGGERPDLLVLGALHPARRSRRVAGLADRLRRHPVRGRSRCRRSIGLVALLTLPVRRPGHGDAARRAGRGGALRPGRAPAARCARVEGGRDAARVAEAASLRRLERDIHDGPQQRLVRLSMDLGRARKQLDQDPERAAETIDAALLQARETVDELRSLSRGIAPPLLVDRGLRAALGELMVRSDLPVEAVVRVPEDLPPHVETAVYFVVAEALTNVAKHSGATRASVARRGRRRRRSTSGSRTTAAAAPTSARGRASPGSRSGSPASTARSRSRRPTAVRRCWLRRSRCEVDEDRRRRRLGPAARGAPAAPRRGGARGRRGGRGRAGVRRRRPRACAPTSSIVDVRMPPSHTDEGLRAAVEVRRAWPEARIMVLSQYVEVSYADDLLASGEGGTGYLLKDRVSDVDDFLARPRQRRRRRHRARPAGRRSS